MKRNNLWTYGIFIVLTQAVGGLSAFLSRNGMKAFARLPQSSLTPPPVVFAIAWTILYTLMAVGAARIWLSPPTQARGRGMWLFIFQLIFNFFWSLFFFNMQAFGFSLLWLIIMWVLILAMTLTFREIAAFAAWIQVPYLIWVAFAGYLNFAAWRLNG